MSAGNRSNGATSAYPTPTVRRAMPGYLVDLAHNGVPSHDLQEHADRTQSSALVSLAMSAQHCGWTESEFHAFVTHPARDISRQIKVTRNMSVRGDLEVRRSIEDAWNAGGQYIAAGGRPWPREEVRAKGRHRARRARARLNQEGSTLSGNDRAVLVYLINRLENPGALRLAVPRRAIMEATGLGQTAVSNALTRLTSGGWLTLEERGRPSGPNAKHRRAHVWALVAEPSAVAAPDLSSGRDGSVRPPATPRSRVPMSNVPAVRPRLRYSISLPPTTPGRRRSRPRPPTRSERRN